ncbi:MAG: Gp15 family bacteriophage protein [Eubacterium sp.]
MMYPEYAIIDGKEYVINTDFNVALKCFEVIEDEEISDTERALAVIFLLFGFIPENNLDEFLEKATLYLQCGEKSNDSSRSERDMDLTADRCYINASFMSDYKIDLSKEKMHYWMFIDLLKGLTENSILSRVREIRNYDLSDIKDAKTRNKILKSQEAVALPKKLTKEEQEAIDNFEKLFAKGE